MSKFPVTSLSTTLDPVVSYPKFSSEIAKFPQKSPSSKALSCVQDLISKIWNSNSLSQFKSKVDQCKKLCHRCIDRTATKWKVSPFLTAILFGDINKAEYLLENGAKITAKDYQGNTALHYAALNDDRAIEKWLLEQGANKKASNNFGASYKTVRLWTRFKDEEATVDSPSTEICKTDENNGSTSCSPKKFETLSDQLAKANFDKECIPTDEHVVGKNVISAKKLKQMWDNKESIKGFNLPLHNKKLKNSFYTLKKEGEKVQVKPSTKLKEAGFNETMCGLFADRDFKAGELIAEYHGLIDEQNLDSVPTQKSWKSIQKWAKKKKKTNLIYKDSTYRFENIDSARFRSAASMSNDGFPNTQLFSIEDGKRQFHHILLALEPIASGEEIVWNYGVHYGGKIDHHTEIRPKELTRFFSKHSISDYEKYFMGMQSAIQDSDRKLDIKALNLFSKIDYPFHTPSAMIDLISEGLVTSDQLKDLFINSYTPKIVNWGGGTIAAAYEIARTVEATRLYDKEIAKEVCKTLNKNLHLFRSRHRYLAQLRWSGDLGTLFHMLNRTMPIESKADAQKFLIALPKLLKQQAKKSDNDDLEPMKWNEMMQPVWINLIEEAGKNPVWL